jgi:ATP-dependent RNA helicase DDX58
MQNGLLSASDDCSPAPSPLSPHAAPVTECQLAAAKSHGDDNTASKKPVVAMVPPMRRENLPELLDSHDTAVKENSSSSDNSDTLLKCSEPTVFPRDAATADEENKAAEERMVGGETVELKEPETVGLEMAGLYIVDDASRDEVQAPNQSPEDICLEIQDRDSNGEGEYDLKSETSHQLLDVTATIKHGTETTSESSDSSSPNEEDGDILADIQDQSAEDGRPLTEPLVLRNYQEELTHEALQGKNCLIIAPTGTGKTHVALSIAKQHLETDSFEEDRKVIFFVPTVALVTQQLRQFLRYMDPSLRCQGLSGEEVSNLSLTDIVAANDVLVMTPQIILNALEKKTIESLSVFSLLIFDECHKMMKNHPYNGIMSRYYVHEMLRGKDAAYRLPQVVGLTASPGVGKANSTEQAADHILQLCANMAASEICTVRNKNNLEELLKHVNNPNDDTEKVRGRVSDPFKEKISDAMIQIENRLRFKADSAELNEEVPNIKQLVLPPAERGSDPFTQFLSRLKRAVVTLSNQDLRRFFLSCIRQLEVYNNALLINADCRTKDALNFIKNEFEELGKHCGTSDQTDLWLAKLFSDMENDLNEISLGPYGDNPKLHVLEKKIRQFYEQNSASQGIVFCKTRAMTVALVAWMKETPSLASLNPHNLIGANRPTAQGAEVMTHNRLEDVLKYFKGGEHKVIVATTVAEEGLDVKQCNYVVRYEHVTNDIARVQARGRARAENATYVLVAERGRGTIERDEANKLRERMMSRALNHIYSLPHDSVAKRINELQLNAKVEQEMAAKGKILSETLKKARTTSGDHELRCLQCNAFGTWNTDLRTIAEVHHVTLDENYESRVILQPHPKPKKFDNWEMRAKILCKNCRKDLGTKAIFNGVPYCVLKISSFIIIGPYGERHVCKKWKDVPFEVDELSPADMQSMCNRAAGILPVGPESPEQK